MLLDEAGTALRLEALAQLIGVVTGAEGPDLGAEIGPLVTQLLAADDGLTVAEQGGEFGLHRAERSLRFVLALLGQELDEIAALIACGGCA